MDIDVEKLAQGVGLTEEALRRIIDQLGPWQRWVLQRLMTHSDAGPWPPWVSITELAREYPGEGSGRPSVDAIRRACSRLERRGLVETSQCWIEGGESRKHPLRLRREATVRRRHLCVRLPLCPEQRQRWEERGPRPEN